ncbi:hypothetical protein ACFY1A_01850 [Streptomyces sp. NPDC001520]|uniref:beta family protein n=1 Tax=Streptomyces sp. NPDC001520 TaxID=3364581 RepID=UPI00369A6AFC
MSAPLWTLPPRPGMLPDLLAVELRKDAGRVSTAHRYRSAWLDTPFTDENEAAVLAETLPPEWWAQRNLHPVTGPCRPVPQQSLALAAAQRRGGGLGIRVRVPGEWHDRDIPCLCALLDRACPIGTVDLFLHLGAVPPSRRDAAKEALRALDVLVPLAPWRTVFVVAGGFPEPPEGFLESAWHEPTIGLGHHHPSYFLAKALQRGEHRDAVNRDAARCLTRLADFRGPSVGTGEGWLRDCAQGSVTTGNHSVWNRVGNIQHMTFVVNCLAGQPG